MNSLPPPPGTDSSRPDAWTPPTAPTRPPSGPPTFGAPDPTSDHAHQSAVTTVIPATSAGPDRGPDDHRWRRRLGMLAAIVLIAVGAGAVGAVVGREIDDDPVPPQEASEAALDVAPDRSGDLPAIDVAAVADRIAPSVVTVSADLDGAALGAGSSIGTGVITTSDGEIVTNAHVVENATEIRVRLAGETEPREATLLAADPGNDLALLRIAGSDFTPAVFADPGSVAIGDEVVAIGFALDLDGDPSVTKGIVSALERTIVTQDGGALDGLVQTDAAISSGNSGGPLVNAGGEVVGINTAVARGDALTAASNIGFAISASEAIPVVEALREQADGATRDEGYLGVGLDDRSDGGQGALITDVQDSTPASDAGILVDDVVIAVDDTAVDGAAGLVAAIRDREPGDDVEVVVLRNGEEVTVTLTLTDRPEG